MRKVLVLALVGVGIGCHTSFPVDNDNEWVLHERWQLIHPCC